MKAKYKFEEDLLKEYCFDVQNGSPDELDEKDRENFSGMLFALYLLKGVDIKDGIDVQFAKLAEAVGEIVDNTKESMIDLLYCEILEALTSMLDDEKYWEKDE